MEDNFNNRDFEQFVKQNADQYRMFPSEKVWKNIHHSLHTSRNWSGLGLILLFLIAGIVTWVMLIPSVRNNGPVSDKQLPSSQSTETIQKKSSTPVLIAASKPTDTKTRFISTSDNLQNNLFLPAPESNPENNNYETKNTIPVLSNRNEPDGIMTSTVHNELPSKTAFENNKTPFFEKTVNTNFINLPKNISSLSSELKKAEVTLDDIKPAVETGDVDPMSIESVVTANKRLRNGKKMSWEVFITPSISYRKLTENKDFINSAQANNNLFNYTSVADINTLVTHRPDMGLQLGFTGGFPITKSLNIIGGFQFNVSKYDIKASFSTGEVATIALNTGGGANSVSTISNYRNSSSSKADWLRNFYFSASVPVGLELKLSGSNKKEFGITGTIQPTYVLSDRAYLLSTDYKNYVEVPSLIRRWNMNASFGFYAGFTTGKLDWKIGPQARYQLKSSFKAKYPVKEHLFDFGLKAGIMLRK